MSSDPRPVTLVLSLGVASVATIALHVVYVPRYVPDEGLLSVPFVLAGWTTFAFVFYAAGRLSTTPDALPNMRTADVGVGLVLVSLLIAGALNVFGFGFESIPEAYVLPAIGLYVGIALVGWSLGRRTAAINRIASEE